MAALLSGIANFGSRKQWKTSTNIQKPVLKEICSRKGKSQGWPQITANSFPLALCKQKGQALIVCFFVIKNKEGGRRRRGGKKFKGEAFTAL